MIKPVAAFVTAALLAIPLAGQSAIDEVRKRTAELEEAATHKDIATLGKMLTDDFLRTPPGGRDTNKAEWLGLIESGRLNYVKFEDSEEKYRAYGDTVLVNVLSNIHTRTNERENETKLKLIWVWVKQNGQWRLAAVQGNQITAR
jgi:ketosteroid isomerase-like protein